MKKLIYQESFLPLRFFLASVIVHCPSCQSKGLIKTNIPQVEEQTPILDVFYDSFVSLPAEYNTWKNATFSCSACHKTLRSQNTKESRLESWQGSFICQAKKICSYCKQFGHSTELHLNSKAISRAKLIEFSKNVEISCHKCPSTEIATWECEPYTPEGLMIDPIFGLPLFLKRAIGKHIFWAYNVEHLSHLRAYIAAKERQLSFYISSSTTENFFKSHENRKELSSFSQILPTWVKEAKNREILIKNIDSIIKDLTEDMNNKKK